MSVTKVWATRVMSAGLLILTVAGNLAISSLAAEVSSPNDPGHYQFRLRKGQKTSVCEAYLQQLNMTSFKDPPYCHWEQQLAGDSPGFTPLEKVQLSAEDLFPLIGHVNDFLVGQQVDVKKERRRTYNQAGHLIGDPDYSLQYVQRMLGTAQSDAANYHMKAWRYQPDVDIENDGHPERLLFLQGDVKGKTTCAVGWSPEDSAVSRIEQRVFVMTPDGSNVDVTKTRTVFGHPYGNPSGNEFRPVGDTIGIFKYRDVYYFDSFLQGPGDFVNRRQTESALFKTLDVFKRGGGRTLQVCEYDVE